MFASVWKSFAEEILTLMFGMFARHRMFIHLLATVQLTINPLTGATPIADGTSAGSYGTLPPYADSYGTAY